MTNDRSRERDLVLAPNEYAFISDQTKGNINVYVGPYKTSLANTDQPVYFDEDSKRFIRCSLEESTMLFATAPEGWYMTMKNPAKDSAHPSTGTVSSSQSLEVGHKVNIPGPSSFALWPGQMIRVIKGHHIRSNQYLVVRVYDEESAKKNWSRAVIKQASTTVAASAVAGDQADVLGDGELPELTMGKQLVIKGTEVSFYIPPTGVEVVRDMHGNYIREAVTLERLEYCILLDEGGNKRFIQGPAVVFPDPTETFVERQGTRKFRAIELNELSGIYVKVITPYEEADRRYSVGEELFITGKEQMIYFPRPEHAIIRYGEREIHYAVAIPAGEGRYCLDRQTGQIRLVRGPTMFLPDPRKEVVVRRVLDPGQVKLWFPGNNEALEYNLRLKELLSASTDRFVLDAEVRDQRSPAAPAKAREAAASDGFAGDEISRRGQFTPPRTITLNTKYDGAVTIGLWTGYAVLVVSKIGDRKVIVGPQTHLLEYDEAIESMSLSTGTPKTDERHYKTSYLRIMHNKVSDLVEAETKDLCQVRVQLSYRVNFEGEPEKWFNVENYVKFLTDHMRSVLRNAIKRLGVEEFYANSITIVRDTILGKTGEDGAKRPGRIFSENGMRIYDVEVLDVILGDSTIESLLTDAQHSLINQTLELANEERMRSFVKQTESIKREVMATQAETVNIELALRVQELQKRLDVRLAELDGQAQTQRAQIDSKLKEQEALGQINHAELGRQQAQAELALSLEEQRLKQRLTELDAQVSALAKKAEAVSPDLIAALQSFSDRALVERVSASMAPMAILGGESVADVLGKLLRGTPLEYLTSTKASKDEL